MTFVSDDLVEAYRNALYEIDADGETIRSRIDRADAAIDTALARAQVREAAFLTAYNPTSVPLCEAENKAAHENLRHGIAARGYASLPARGVDPDNAWPA